MDPENWQQIEEFYHLALPLKAAERGTFLERVCAGRTEVRREVESLLAAHDSSEDFLQRPVFQVGLEVLADESLPDAEVVVSATAPVAALDLIGMTLASRYYIEQLLDSGGIGDVYLARDKPELMSRRVVVKVLQEKALKNKWIVTKFRQEIEALTRIDDPGVVGILDAGALPDGNPYLVMQFVDGEKLRQHMRPDRGMELGDAAHIMQQVGRTLTAAHDNDIIHRDLKPENIMVRRRADGMWQIKVIDFGIAKVRHSLIAPSTVTGNAAGTANYMSPEQLQGKNISAPSDVYALGVIAYEMVTGRRPFNPETAFQLSDMQRAGVTIEPRALRPGLPLAAQNVILTALSYQPADRYKSARAFGDDLAKALLAYEDDISTWDKPRGAEAASVSNAQEKAGAQSNEVQAIASAAAPPRPRVTWPVLLISLVALGLLGIVAWRYWFAPSVATNVSQPTPTLNAGPERTLTYWLTMQRMYQDKPLGKTFDATGRDYFHTGDKFMLNIVPDQPGALYLINEGLDENGATEWNLLFPTKANNRAQPQLSAQQQISTKNYQLTGSAGVEKIWLVWATKPIPLLDSIFQGVLDGEDSDGVIRSLTQQTQLQEFLQQMEASQTALTQDEMRARAILKGRGEILVRRLDLSHKPNN